MPQTLAVIPVFNEIEHLSHILRCVRRHLPHVLIIDDGSTDGSGAFLVRQDHLHCIVHPSNLGYGQSLIDAFRFAAQTRFDWIITLDADHQHNPNLLPRFLEEIARDDADVISGSRYLVKNLPSAAPPPPDRIALNKYFTALLNINLSFHLTDAFCGFKAYRVGPLSQLGLSEPGYAFPLQFWVRAARASLRIREIPVPLIYFPDRRPFTGPLADAHVRAKYYQSVLSRELNNDHQNFPFPAHP